MPDRSMFSRPAMQKAGRVRRRRVLLGALAVLAGACQGTDPAGSRAVAASAAMPFTERAVVGFDTPWALAFLPDAAPGGGARALVTEKDGRLWLVDVDSGTRTAVAGVPPVLAAGQGGLGDVAPHPDFAANRRVYLSFVEAGEGGTSGAALGYATLVALAPAVPGGQAGYQLADFKIIWRQSPKVTGNGHFAHRIAFGPDGLLYLSSGDRQKFDPAQDMAGNLGKILRLTDEGAPAPGNPFASQGGIAATVYSLGHRNPLGLAFAPDGRLWETEMGPKGGDELNLVRPGRNYGWPKASNGSHYDDRDIPDHRAGDGFEPPRAFWTPSISPGGLLVYSGGAFAGWKGDALLPALSGEALVRLRLSGDTAIKADHWPMGRRLRAVEEGPGGRLFLLEDGGRLVELLPAR